MHSLKNVPDVLKIILEAKHLEDGVIVTKKNGNIKYTLRRSIKIYGENRTEIKCDVDNIFLVDEDANITQINENTELLVHINSEILYYDLDEYINYDDK